MKIPSLLACLAFTLIPCACQSAAPTLLNQSAPVLTLDAATTENPAFTRTTDAHGVTRVYHHTFETAPGPEWSCNTIGKTPNGDRPYLGDFSSRKPVTLALNNLPQHDLVRITFDLFLINGWNGSAPYWGFGRWDLNLADGRNLIHTSFSNCGGEPTRLSTNASSNEQSFPDSFDIRIYRGFTGATEQSTLLNGQENYSSVYHFALTFPHTDKDITFGFHSVIQEGTNRVWGVSNLSVETLSALPVHTERELAQLWKDLGDVDPLKAFTAQWELAAAGDQAVDYVARHLDEKIDLTVEDITTMVKDLESADKNQASDLIDQIVHQGTIALFPLREAFNRDDIAPEYKTSLNAAIYIAKRHNATATQLRVARATQLLEIIHTKSALALKLTIPEPPPRNVDAPNPAPVNDGKPRPVGPEIEVH